MWFRRGVVAAAISIAVRGSASEMALAEYSYPHVHDVACYNEWQPADDDYPRHRAAVIKRDPVQRKLSVIRFDAIRVPPLVPWKPGAP